MIKRIFIVAHILIIATSCNYKNIVNSDAEIIDVGKVFSENKLIKLSDVVDKVKYIPLESNKECLIGNVSKVFFSKNRIFVLDSWHSKTLFVFDKDGKYINKIGKVGRGPGEYMLPLDFEVDESRKKVFIMDLPMERLNEYNIKGDYIRSYNIKEKAPLFKFINKSRCAFYSIYSSDVSKQYFLNIKNINNNSAKRYFEHDKLIYNNEKPEMCFCQYNDSIFYLPYTGNEIYRLGEDEPYVRYKFHFGKLEFPVVTKSNKNKVFNNRKNYCTVGRYGITDSLIWFTYHYKLKNYTSFYNKQSKTIKTGIVNNDIDGLPFWPRWGKTNCLVTAVDASCVIDPESVLDGNFLKKNEVWVRKLSIDSNPILCLYKLK